MDKSHEPKATLILGANGFLGRELHKLYSKDDSVYQTVRGKECTLMKADRTEIDLSILSKYHEVHVVNCSSGRLQSLGAAEESNYNFPVSIMENVLEKVEIIKWTQFDSYTQYSKDIVHDKNYVSMKNKFNNFLRSRTSQNSNFSITQISLPHLYGAGDKITRFLPKTFQKILLDENLNILSPKEVIPIIDVNDCAKIVLEIFARAPINEKNQKVRRFSIEPTEIVQIYELFFSFKTFTKSQCILTRGKEFDDIFIEKWVESEQPKKFRSKSTRTSRFKTFRKIVRELEI